MLLACCLRLFFLKKKGDRLLARPAHGVRSAGGPGGAHQEPVRMVESQVGCA